MSKTHWDKSSGRNLPFHLTHCQKAQNINKERNSLHNLYHRARILWLLYLSVSDRRAEQEQFKCKDKTVGKLKLKSLHVSLTKPKENFHFAATICLQFTIALQWVFSLLSVVFLLLLCLGFFFLFVIRQQDLP